MPVLYAADAVVHELHGSVFTSFAAPARGSRELCAWRLEVPPGTRGVPHAVSKEEVLLVLSGALHVTLDGTPARPPPGRATRCWFRRGRCCRSTIPAPSRSPPG